MVLPVRPRGTTDRGAVTRRAAAARLARPEVSHIRPIFRQYHGDPETRENPVSDGGPCARMAVMLTDHFPLLGLRVTTPRLRLALPDEQELSALALLASRGVHDPATMPFFHPWTRGSPHMVARSVVQHHWRTLGELGPQRWTLPFTVFEGPEPVGVQAIDAADFAVTREVHSGSWLGLRHQGRGIGTEMRAAALHLAFDGLGAQCATSGAYTDNPASLRVSAKLGYRPDGTERRAVEGRLKVEQRLRLTREDWRRHAAVVPVELHGVAPCLELLGAAGPRVSNGEQA